MTMRSIIRMWLLTAIMACAAAAWGAPGGQDPYIGYVYPAGGQQGTKFEVTLRGQRLKGASDVYISGQGVRASVLDYEGVGGPLSAPQEEELRRQLQEIRAARSGGQVSEKKQNKAAKKQTTDSTDNAKGPVATLPDLPDLKNLDQQTNKQLRHVADKYLQPRKTAKVADC